MARGTKGTRGRQPGAKYQGGGGRKRGASKRSGKKSRSWTRVLSFVVLAVVALGAAWLVYRGYFTPSTPNGIDQPADIVPDGPLNFEVYFGNSEKDPDGLDCELVFPVKRTVKGTRAVAKSAIEALLAGPTKEEEAAGYFTSVNPGVKLLGINLEGAVANVDFSGEVEEGLGGSCQVESIHAQLRKTLGQFKSIQEVRVTVNGRASEALQP